MKILSLCYNLVVKLLSAEGKWRKHKTVWVLYSLYSAVKRIYRVKLVESKRKIKQLQNITINHIHFTPILKNLQNCWISLRYGMYLQCH